MNTEEGIKWNTGNQRRFGADSRSTRLIYEIGPTSSNCRIRGDTHLLFGVQAKTEGGAPLPSPRGGDHRHAGGYPDLSRMGRRAGRPGERPYSSSGNRVSSFAELQRRRSDPERRSVVRNRPATIPGGARSGERAIG